MISGAIISANIKRERVADMGKYEYNFVEVPFDGDLKSGNAETIEKCKDIIRKEFEQLKSDDLNKPIERKKGIDKQQQLCHCF